MSSCREVEDPEFKITGRPMVSPNQLDVKSNGESHSIRHKILKEHRPPVASMYIRQCCGGNCGCGSSCKCGSGCGGCKMYPNFSFSRESPSEALLVGLYLRKGNVSSFFENLICLSCK